MRNDRKTIKTAEISRVQGYHEGGGFSESYAFAGFASNKYFTSDRFIKIDERFNRPDGKPLCGFGLEIETECNGISNPSVLAEVLHKIVFAHFPADLFKLQRDASLGGNSSAECITQVMTREFIRNNYANFKLMYDTYFPAFRISAAGSNCGMHCNISRAVFGANEKTQTEAVRKLYYIVNHHFDLCCALFHRNRNATGYCAKMRCAKDYCKTLDLSAARGGHGVSFNLDHWDTGRVELRLVGGQSSFPCFRNTMESVFHLCAAVKKLSWADCDDLTKIFAGCNQYVYDRLKSFCRQAGTITDEQLATIRATVKREELI
jgi:hypothetical protein